MATAALVLALVSAVIHALWNLLTARSRDSEAALAIAMTLGPLLAIPLAIATWRVDAEAVPYLLLSGSLELTYMVLLGRAYRAAEMSLVYPIARGMAPVFVLAAGWLLLGQSVAPLSALGIGVVALGVVLVRGFRGGGSLRHVLLALTIAAVIASYTLVDSVGLRYANPIPYAVLITGIPGAILVTWIAWRDGPARIRAAATPSIALAGVSTIAAYGLVLAALRLAPAAMVSAVRETSVVFGTALAAIVLHERVDRTRIAGALLVTLGVILVVVG